MRKQKEHISLSEQKKGLAAAKAQGKLLGRPKGSKNKKERLLDPYQKQIKNYHNMGLTMSAVLKVINNQLKRPISYQSLRYHIKYDQELKKARTSQFQKK